MDHQEALAIQAVERYLLNELSSSQKESFEEHYFECPACAAALREQEIFMANAKAVLRENPVGVPVSKPGLLDWIKTGLNWQVLAPAMAGILIVLVGIPYLGKGEIVSQHLNAQTRSAGDSFTIPSNARSVKFAIDLKPGDDAKVNRWEHLTWTLTDADGREVDHDESSAAKDQEQLELRPIRVRKLPAGRYRLTVHPGNGSADEVSTFVIQR